MTDATQLVGRDVRRYSQSVGRWDCIRKFWFNKCYIVFNKCIATVIANPKFNQFLNMIVGGPGPAMTSKSG